MKNYRFLKKLLVLTLILIASSPQMWAQNVHVKTTSHIYFEPLAPDGTTWDWSDYSYIYFVIGDAHGWRMDAISNTLLRHCGTSEYNNSGIRLFAAKSDWGADNSSMGGWDNMSKDANCNNITDWWNNGGDWYTFDNDKSYIISLNKTGSKSDLATISAAWNSDGYSGMNKQHTLKAKISLDNGSSYSEANTPGALSAATKTFSNYTTCNTASNGSLSAGSSSSNFNSGYTAEITLTAATSVTGHVFMGWYAGSTELSTSNGVATDRARSATTYYAYYKANQYTITLARNDGSGNTDSQTATYGASAATRSGSLPTRTGYGFDGYWTTADNSGTRVIDKNGDWIASKAGYTDSNTKWICTSNQTLYAHWLATGYYLAGEFNDWEGTHVFSGSPLTATIALSNSGAYRDGDGNTTFKIRQVNQSSSTGSSENWYSRNVQIGKSSTTADNLDKDKDPIKLEVYYTGDYTFTLDVSGSKPAVTVAVPVIDQLQIYNSDPSGGTGINNHNWGSPVGNIVSKTVTLDGGTTYEFKAVYESVFYGLNSGTISDGDSLALNSSGGNVSITTTRDGDYQFDFNTKTHKIIVTYPTSYSITVVAGTGIDEVSGSVTYAAPSTNYPISATVSTGYTWSAWSKSGVGATNAVVGSTASTNAQVVDGNTTFTANATEDTHTVTVAVHDNYSNAGGTTNVTSVTGVGISTASGTITATPANAAWRFKEWTIPDGVTIASGSTTTASITINATADSKTITANFEPRYGLVGSRKADGNPAEGMPANGETTWDEAYAADFVVKDFDDLGSGDGKGVDLECSRTLLPNREYKFKVYDREKDVLRGCTTYGGATLPANTNWELNGTNDVWLSTVGYGTYVFHITNISDDDDRKPSLQVDRQASYTVTYGAKTDYAADGSIDATTAGGSITSVKTTEDAVDYDIATGQYVRSGGTVVFTAAPVSGYSLKGWYSDDACGSKYVDNSSTIIINDEAHTLTLSNIGANTTVYALFEENMTTVDIYKRFFGTVVISGESEGATSTSVGVHTKKTLTVAPNEGHWFSGFTIPDGADFGLESQSTTEAAGGTVVLKGLGAGDKTRTKALTVNFGDLDRIYFRNYNVETKAPLWDSVYVGFDPTDWDGTNGTDVKGKTSVAMKNLGITNIWWAYVPRDFTANNKYKIAFFDHGVMRNYDHFANSDKHASYRTDYRRSTNLFVPYHESNVSKLECKYYSNGYWMPYTTPLDAAGTDAGYIVKRYNGSSYVDVAAGSSSSFTMKDETTMLYNLRVDNTGSGHNNYVIVSPASINYITKPDGGAVVTGDTVKTNHHDNLTMTEYSGTPRFYINPTSEGFYMLTIDMSSDVMKLNVNYPVAVGDYRLTHSYKVKGVASGEVDSVVYTHSNVIKAGSEFDTLSMYVNTSSTPTLILEKCTAISGKTVTWTDQIAGLSIDKSAGKFDDGNAVYQFVFTDASSARTLSDIKPYEGDYYLKADTTKGGWTAYKENAMDKNTVSFSATDPYSYDYYWCHYYYTNAANIKCVVANDYCNQLSDTLKNDGISRMSGTEPYVPVAGTSIRFSYNSATNTIKRSYLGASKEPDFLNIEPKAAGYIFNTTPTDLYGQSAANRKFSDNENWVYEMDLKVIPGGQAGVSATYEDANGDDHVQMFLPLDNIVLNGDGKSSYTNKYDIRVTYDFKTNYLMSAFVLTETPVTEALQDFDMLWVRHKDESPTQLTLSGSGSMSNVRVIGAIELRYDSLYYGASGDGHVSTSTWTPQNRPFLKYFISFPFDVEVNSIFGLNQAQLGREYAIQKYDGVTRAKEGLFLGDDDNYWINLTKDSVMHANEGYCVIFDNDYAGGWSGHIWDNKKTGNSVFLYFPAKDRIASISTSNTTTTVAPHYCEVDRWWTNNTKKNHIETDSHWNLIGQPLFHDAMINSKSNTDTFKLRSYYKLNYETNKWNTVAVTDKSTRFPAMSSVLVQWCGEVEWTATPAPSPVVARRTNEHKNYLAQLDIAYNGDVVDWTYVQLEDGTQEDFVLREDMCKMYNNGIPQIYTFAGAYDVAFNATPVQNQTIPVGVVIRKNGTYTFSMPTSFSGTVTLIDTFDGTRTNLAMEDYEVYLNKGTIDDRFLLEISINNAPTAIDGATDGEGSLKDGKAHKFIQNGVMYILENGRIYDAQGRRLQ